MKCCLAVPVGGRNFFKLMQMGEAALLYPGGVREVSANGLSCIALVAAEPISSMVLRPREFVVGPECTKDFPM